MLAALGVALASSIRYDEPPIISARLLDSNHSPSVTASQGMPRCESWLRAR